MTTKDKHNAIWFGIIFAVFMIGDIMWASESREVHDFGIIIATLSGAVMAWFCFTR